MDHIQFFASPWYIDLLIFVPILSYFIWFRKGLSTSWLTLFCVGLFAVAFGINEAVVDIYLRAALGFLPNYATALSQAAPLAFYSQEQLFIAVPRSILVVEMIREIATMIVLVSVAFVVSKVWRERWALFLWSFALWDLFYYLGLWTIVRWPYSPLTQDVLFLVPFPWLAQVWLPILVDLLAIVAVLMGRSIKMTIWNSS